MPSGGKRSQLLVGCPYLVRFVRKDSEACFEATVVDLNHTCNTSIVRERSISIKRLKGAIPFLNEYVPHNGGGGAGRSDAVQLRTQLQNTTGVALTYSTSFQLVGKQSAFSPASLWVEIGEIEAFVAALKQFDPDGVYDVRFVLDSQNRRRFETVVWISSWQIRFSRASRGVASAGFVFLFVVLFWFYFGFLI